MTNETFDRASYGVMSVADLAAAFERSVGEPPEKRNKLWMLKRMEQAASARDAAQRAVERASGREEDAGGETAPGAGAPPTETQPPDPCPPAADVVGDEGGTEGVAEPAAAPPVTDAPPVESSPAAPASGNIAPPAGDGGVVEAEDDGEGAAGAASGNDEKPPRRRYIPARFRAMTLVQIHEKFASTVGRPTKSTDVPYLCWRITRAERLGSGAPSAPRRSRTTGPDGAPRGEAKAVTLREYPDTLAALEGVCARHGLRNRLDFFRRAARHYLEDLGEPEVAAFFAEMAPAGAPASAAS